MNEEQELGLAFEKAAALHALLTRFHPSNSDELAQLIAATQDPVRKNRLVTLNDFLLNFTTDALEGKPSKTWDAQIHLMNRLARNYVEKEQRAPATHLKLMEYLIDHIGDDLRLVFNEKAGSAEPTYESAYKRVTKRFTDKGVEIPSHVKTLHDFTYGDLSLLNRWMQTPPHIPSNKSFGDRFLHFVETQQLHAVSRMVKRMDPDNHGHALYALACQARRDADMKTGEQYSFLPLEFKDHMTPQEIISSIRLSQLARNLHMPLAMIVGVEPVFTDPGLAQDFDIEVYKKIRNFLGYEYENVLDLNRATSLMTLVFADYNKFANYAVKKGVYDSHTGGIGLKSLIDTSGFNFEVRDYQAWGTALLDRGPVMNFYIKNAHLLDDVPRNDKGVLKISQIDFQLYRKITELVDSMTSDDLERYRDLKIVSDVQSVLDFKKRCREATEGKELSDTPKSVPRIEIDGSRFGRPGQRFGFLPYDDPRFPLIGRFTDSCERAGGDYEATLLHACTTRDSGVWCIFDEENEPVAHTLIERRSDDWAVLIKGFEGQSSVSKSLLQNLVAEIRKDHPQETFIVGTSSLRIGWQEVMTVDRAELADNHVVQVDPAKIFNAARIIEESPVLPTLIHVNQDENTDEKLKEVAVKPYIVTPKEP